MNTYKIEAFSVEPGDQIVIGKDIYKVIESDYSETEDDSWSFILADEEGYRRFLTLTPRENVEILFD